MLSLACDQLWNLQYSFLCVCVCVCIISHSAISWCSRAYLQKEVTAVWKMRCRLWQNEFWIKERRNYWSDQLLWVLRVENTSIKNSYLPFLVFNFLLCFAISLWLFFPPTCNPSAQQSAFFSCCLFDCVLFNSICSPCSLFIILCLRSCVLYGSQQQHPMCLCVFPGFHTGW